MSRNPLKPIAVASNPSPSPDQIPPDVSNLSDHELKEKIERISKTLSSGILKLSDKGAKLRSNLSHFHHELDRRRANSASFHLEIGECLSNLQTKNVTLQDPSKEFGPTSKESNPEEKLPDETVAASSENLCSTSNDCQPKRRKKRSSKKKFSDNECSSIPSIHDSENLSRRSSKRRKTSSRYGSKKLEFEEAPQVVLLDDEDVKPMHSIQAGDLSIDNCVEQNIFYPSRDDPECVELSRNDLKCLDPESYLSSPIMNFYIQYLQRYSSRKAECHIFNTYFYSKLEEAMICKDDKTTSFLKLRRWWKGVDIFQKAYVFLPIHGDMHWSLVIICVPAKKDDSGLIILHLDSLGIHSSSHIFYVVSNYLKEEWNYVTQNDPLRELPFSKKIWKHLPRRIEKQKIMVPQQKNEYDCGLFVLYFMQQFIKEAPDRLRKNDLISMFGKTWFHPDDASGLRKIVKELLVKEFESTRVKENQELSSSPPRVADNWEGNQ